MNSGPLFGPVTEDAVELPGSVSGELGLRTYLERLGHELVVTSDKEAEGSLFEQHLGDAEVVISQPFWPAYLTAERIAKAPKLKQAITAGIGSDHVVMMILSQVRNYLPSHQWVREGGWNIADCVERSYDLEGMQVGTVAAGRIGLAVLRRLAPFDVGLHYFDKHRLPAEVEADLSLTHHASVQEMVPHLDVVTINAPLHPETRGLFDDQLIGTMKRVPDQHRSRAHLRPRCGRARTGKWPTRWLRRRCGVSATRSGRAPVAHRANHGMTPHISGSTLSAQARYAAGTREILESHFAGTPIRDEYLIVAGGELAGTGARSYTAKA